jgi:RNA polymerase sigma factor (sigma-70 family)
VSDRLVTQNLDLVQMVVRVLGFYPRDGHFDQEDLVGVGNIALLKAARSFNGTGDFRTWAYPIVRGAVIDAFRVATGHRRVVKAGTVSIDQPAYTETLPAPDNVVELAARRERICQALNDPDKRKREIYIRRAAGQTDDEIAHVLGVTGGRISQIANSTDTGDTVTLTVMELAVVQGAAVGETTEDTAARIGRSPDTVKTHRSNVIKKVGARNMTHAVHLISPLLEALANAIDPPRR